MASRGHAVSGPISGNRGQLGLGEWFCEGVFGADRGCEAAERIERPGDGELWIVPEDGALACGEVKVGGLVEHFGGLGEDEEAVGVAFGDPEKLKLAGIGERPEVEAGPGAELGRVAAKIDGYVPDVAGEDADQLALWFAELVMEAAENALPGEGLVILHELAGEAGGGEGVCMEHFGKPAAVISEARRMHELYVTQRGFEDPH